MGGKPAAKQETDGWKRRSSSVRARWGRSVVLDLSVVIVNYDTKALLRECLYSLYGKDTALFFDVWVVDNASRDGSSGMVEEQFPRVNLIKNSVNVGFSKAANQAIRRSRGKYIFLLNPDASVLPNATEELVKFMDNNPDAGAAGARLLYPDGTLQPSCRAFPRYSLLLFGRESLLTRLFPENPFSRRYLRTDLEYERAQEVDFVAGAAMIVRRRVLEEVGLLDEGFFLFAEDTDLCYRIKEKGWKVYYVPRAVIVHRHGSSTRMNKDRAILEHHKSFYRFLCKHYSPSILTRAALMVALTFRVVTLLTLRAGQRMS